jgi:hypothetical protein
MTAAVAVLRVRAVLGDPRRRLGQLDLLMPLGLVR